MYTTTKLNTLGLYSRHKRICFWYTEKKIKQSRCGLYLVEPFFFCNVNRFIHDNLFLANPHKLRPVVWKFWLVNFWNRSSIIFRFTVNSLCAKDFTSFDCSPWMYCSEIRSSNIANLWNLFCVRLLFLNDACGLILRITSWRK